MMPTMTPITLARFREILDAYGADPSRWPRAERDDALLLLDRSPEARAERAAAARLDFALDLAPSVRSSTSLAARVLARAPQRSSERFARLVAIAAPVAMAATLLLWLVRTPAPSPGMLSEETIAALGSLSAPSDALLGETTGLIDSAPALGCEPGELGCLDLDVPDPQRSEAGRRFDA
jgi:hypothetical protein